MPKVLVKFWEEPREFTGEQVEELRAAGLLREEPGAGDDSKPDPPGPVLTPAPQPSPAKPAQ